ncbi:MAG TPA: hypothetical protein VN282_24590 [Pyrinomonadaceae bacterium]|nr:hypothetical protein [Pyrinomonadaceae bacterium]
MISVKCPACGLVDWNVGDCKRCGTPLAGLGADEGGPRYVPGVSEWAADARAVQKARRVMTVCGAVVLVLVALGALYVANKPAKKQWFWSFYRKDPTVAEIFAHNLEVSGGAERLRKLRSFRAEGRLKFVGGEAERTAAAAGAQVTFVMHAKEPDKVVTEVEIGPPAKTDAARAQELAIRDLPCLGGPCQPGPPEIRLNLRRGFDGSRGWEYVERTILTSGSTVPVKQYSSRELDDDELGSMKRYSQTTSLVRMAEEYTSLKLDGREPVTWNAGGEVNWTGRKLIDTTLKGHEAYVVSGVNKEGKSETFYFDTLTGLLLRVDFEAEDAEGEPVRVECVFGDYKEVGGLKLPHRLHLKRGAETMTMTFEKYVPNDPIPDSTFAPPEPTE